jgi:arylsulfatase A-like enzyme
LLGSLLTNAGYQTCLVGKTHWHLDPRARAGFETLVHQDQWNALRAQHLGRGGWVEGVGWNELEPSLSQAPAALDGNDWVVDQCLEQLRWRERDRPFAQWCSFWDPHPPLVVREPYYSMYRDAPVPPPVHSAWSDDAVAPGRHLLHRWAWNPRPYSDAQLIQAKGVYYGMITHMDHQIGRLFAGWMQEGLWDESLIIYTCDHGEHFGDHGDIGKQTFTEASARIPFLVRPPASWGGDRGRTTDALIELTDLLPTLVGAGGGKVPADIDGRDLGSLLRGEKAVRTELHGTIDDSIHMITDGRHKYLYYVCDGAELLFDRREDPDDRHAIGDATLLATWRRRLWQHLRDEGHPHAEDGGTLLHRHSPRITRREAQARASGACGLNGLLLRS